MDGDRQTQPGAGRENARGPVWKPTGLSIDVVADRLAEPFPGCGAPRDGLIEDATGLLRHAESTIVDFRVDFFGGMAHQRQLKVMDDPGPVHGHGRDDAFRHEVRQNRGKTHLDDVSADAGDHGAPRSMRACNGQDDGSERLDRQDVGQAGVEFRE